jgi:uncharacterized protein
MASGSGGGLVYLDSSAFMKLVTAEAESNALRRHLRRRGLRTSAVLLLTETLRASARLPSSHLTMARDMIQSMALIHMDRQLYAFAATLNPPAMRSLDALHVAAALSLGPDLAELITYDARMIEAAQAHGLRTLSPS